MTSPSTTEIPKKVNGLTILLGVANIGDPASYHVRFPTVESAKDYLSVFARRGYRHLDTARNYSPGAPETSEKVLGEVLKQIDVNGEVLKGVPFVVDTKLRYLPPDTHSAEKVKKSVNGSLEALKMEKVHIEYLHDIDETSDKKETCRAMEKAFTEGKFEFFGLSNATAKHIEEFRRVCEEQGLTIRPNVVQNDYSILSREWAEDGDGVIRKAREYGMSFYAFSPAGGGIFNPKVYRERSKGRIDENTKLGKSYRGQWYGDRLLRAADGVREISESNGLNGHTTALRWIVWHSALSKQHEDGIIIAASSIEQLNANLDAIESGPLPGEVLRAVEAIWEKLKTEEE
ncbi:hypothetical protein V5O48_002298 [Marasmius crinis-equi]|uniref:NADP-dependent oxidoreductase domain-containing protein n=1 Tax=Marasmius crinis-equi TaxID=585013 RepID=A0ABR3EZW7_9AGAR